MWVPCQVRRHARDLWGYKSQRSLFMNKEERILCIERRLPQLQVNALLAMNHVHNRDRAKSELRQGDSVHQVTGVLRLLKRGIQDEAHCRE